MDSLRWPRGRNGRPVHARGVVTARCKRLRRHGGEVAGGEPVAQVASSLQNREEEGAGVAPGKFTAVIAHWGGKAMSGGGVGSAWQRLSSGDR
jgi:hypothetical protein